MIHDIRISNIRKTYSHENHQIMFPLFTHDIWANYNNSLPWIVGPFGDDFPNPNYDFQGSLVVSSL